VINIALAIAVPATLHFNGAFPGVLFGAGDEQLLGRSFAGLRHDNPELTFSVRGAGSTIEAMSATGVVSSKG
jgi:hypothetical protein